MIRTDGLIAWVRAHKVLAGVLAVPILLTSAFMVLVVVALVAVIATGDSEQIAADEVRDQTIPTVTVTATVTATATATITASENPTPEREPRTSDRPEPTASEKPEPTPETFVVTRVVDGDTVELGNGETVRVVGIDTPERGECGYAEASAHMEKLVLGERVRLVTSDEDRDRYGRLLRYLDVGNTDAGLEQIAAGLAIARYDSRDGYGPHPRENRYIAADNAAPDKTCRKPTPAPTPVPAGSCEGGYDPCVPVYPPDADCADVNGGPVSVSGSDPHGLDADGDGIACE